MIHCLDLCILTFNQLDLNGWFYWINLYTQMFPWLDLYTNVLLAGSQ